MIFTHKVKFAVLAGFVSLALLFALSACSSDDDGGSGNPPVTTYTITYEANAGGDSVTGTMATQTAKAAEYVIVAQNAFVRDSYYFVGWNTAADGSGTKRAAGEVIELSANITLYAQWEQKIENGSIVTFKVKSKGSYMTYAIEQVTKGSAVAAPSENPTADGGTFEGWFTSADDGTTLDEIPFDFDTAINADLTLYANYSYKIVYDCNAEDGSVSGTMAEQVVIAGRRYKLTKNAYTRTGYLFAGWNESSDGTATSYADGQDVLIEDANYVLFAQWILVQSGFHVVNFDLKGGSGSAVIQQIEDGKTATRPATDPTKTGYDFKDWFTSADGGTTLSDVAFDFSTPITEDIVLYAAWTAKTYTVTFDANAGSESVTGTMASQTFTYGNEQSLTANAFSRGTDKVFDCWNTKADGTGRKYSDGQTISLTENLTLYAQWIDRPADMCTVTYNSNGGSAVAVAMVIKGGSVASPADPTKVGYDFKGWFTSTDGGTTLSDAAFDFAAAITEDVVLYAKWAIKTYTVTFITNGGSPVSTQTIEYNKVASLPTDPTKTGHDFKGWYTSIDGGTTLSDAAFDFAATITKDTTLYALWTPIICTITYFDADGAAFSGTHEAGYATTHTYGTATALDKPAPADAEFSFGGWYRGTKDDSGTVTLYTTRLSELSATGYTADITLYAKWLRSTFYVSASGNDTTGTGDAEAPYATVAQAVTTIKEIGTGIDYTIAVDGMLTECVTIDTELTVDKAKTLTIRGKTGKATDKLDGNESGTVLTLTTAVPITLADITITGGKSSYYTGAGITLNNSNALLTLADGALIADNENTANVYYAGGGVFVYRGTLTLEDGATISANTSDYGGGVMLYSNCTVIMDGGKISNNTSVYCGGGVYMVGGIFTMNGGEISDNVSTGSAGGVRVYGTFTMNGGKIAGNKASSYAGGVYIRSTTFTLNDGEISGNTAGDSGGGIWNEWGNLYLYGGVVSGNTASTGNGGAVRVEGYVCMKGNISIPAGDNGKNDVCFASDSYYIYVTGELTAEAPVATITPNGYSNKKLLCASNGVTMDEDLVAKFALTPEYGVDWHLEIDGNDAWLSAGTYNITYKDVGGEFSGVLADDSPTKHKYSVVTTLKDPTKDGYTFIGWFIGWYEKDGEILTEGSALTSLAAKAYTDDITLYAKWAKQTSSVEIGSKDIAITLDTTAHTLTASDGYKNYIWLVDEEVVADSDTLFTVSADGKTLTYSNDDLLAGCVYTVKVSACDENGVQYQATKTVTRQ
ncbi:MAG: InlB B-repeat-containing protein [Treponema sp.]|nr:InlB B-repeat-containing protein [Treponema sp.]